MQLWPAALLSRRYQPRSILVIRLSILAILLAGLVLSPAPNLQASGPTNIGGAISVDTVLSTANSPYIVTDNLTVQQGVALTIQPGVQLRFAGNYYLEISGTLIARGTSSQPILFTSNRSTPAPSDWGNRFSANPNGINFTDSSTDAVLDSQGNYVSGSVIQYSVVEYGTGLSINASSPFIDHNTFRLNGFAGGAVFYNGYFAGASTGPTISNNLITDNQTIGFSIQQGWAKFVNNSIYRNSGAGTIGGASGLINGNTIACNTKAPFSFRNPGGSLIFMGPGSSTAAMDHNNIVNNGSVDVELRFDSSDVNLANDFWGTTDTTTIASKIIDKNDDASLSGVVTYTPALGSSVSVSYTDAQCAVSGQPPSGGRSLNVPLLKQGVAPFNDSNPPWESLEYDHAKSQSLWCGTSIASCGCALTSIAMVLRYYGAVSPFDGSATDPKAVNDYFKQDTRCGKSGCASLGYSFGDVRWTAAGAYSNEANKRYGSQKIVWTGDGSFDMKTARQEIDSSQPVILGVPNHWVVATGYTNTTLTINDPLFSRTQLDDPAYGNSAVQGMRRYARTNSDFSTFEVAALSPAQVIITDPSGRRTGFDSAGSRIVTDIPNSSYLFDQAVSDDTGVAPPPPSGAGVYFAIVSTPQAGIYQIDVVAPANQTYSFAVYGADQSAGTQFAIFDGQSGVGGAAHYSFSYSPTVGSATPLALQVPIDVKPGSSPNSINLGSAGNVPVAILSSTSFDATKVDPSSITLANASVRLRGQGTPMASVQDVNGDGLPDLVVQISTDALQLSSTDTEVVLRGRTFDGTFVTGTDTVRIVPSS